MKKQMNNTASLFKEVEAMRTIGKFNEYTRLTSLTFSELEVMKTAQIVTESSRLASLAFQKSEAMKFIIRFTESSQFAKKLALQRSEAMRSIKAVTESTRLSSLMFQQSQLQSIAKTSQFAKKLALQRSEAMRSIKAVTESTRLSSLMFQQSQLQSIAKTSQFASIALQQSKAFQKISQISDLASFKALAGLENNPFPEDTVLAFTPEIGGRGIIDESLKEIDAQISAEISSQTDFNALSDKTKSILLYLYHQYFLPVLLSCLSAYVMVNAVEVRKELEPISTPVKVKQFTRAPSHKFDQSLLTGFRVTTVHSLNFGESPSMKSEIITSLPIGSLVEVIDKSHRSWLLVEVEIDGVLEQGWVSRRYTAYFK